ncbi:hypothetical protein CesoFtcFv8_008630 [Champsocephalus esox]|uniref:Uncharacterized protein n=1 Tax=Champsocephalus esox TaxID=159716 RepID=A0AAN8C8P2_9TELE|nr:hypothetical protein CesoFtcFv8_008630 [Champsocephalus esox]
MHVWCAACGHSISACPPPRCARSPFSGVRHHSAGVSRNLIQEALQGVLGCGGGERGKGLPKSPRALHIQTQGSLNQQGGQIIPPPAGCCLKYSYS